MLCIVCHEEVDKVISGVPIHRSCLGNKSLQILSLEAQHKHPINEILIEVIRRFDTWEERYRVLGVSKVTIYCWVRKYLGMTPLQAVSTYGKNAQSTQVQLQTGNRDYMQLNSSIFVPE